MEATLLPVLLAHGASGTSASMRPHVEGLRRRGVAATAIDLPKGRAERAMPVFAQRLGEVGPAIIGGHSYGGRVASMLAASGDPAVRGLVLLSYPLHRPATPRTCARSTGRTSTAPFSSSAGTPTPLPARSCSARPWRASPAPSWSSIAAPAMGSVRPWTMPSTSWRRSCSASAGSPRAGPPSCWGVRTGRWHAASRVEPRPAPRWSETRAAPRQRARGRRGEGLAPGPAGTAADWHRWAAPRAARPVTGVTGATAAAPAAARTVTVTDAASEAPRWLGSPL